VRKGDGVGHAAAGSAAVDWWSWRSAMKDVRLEYQGALRRKMRGSRYTGSVATNGESETKAGGCVSGGNKDAREGKYNDSSESKVAQRKYI
jgi:hypothetical protein